MTPPPKQLCNSFQKSFSLAINFKYILFILLNSSKLNRKNTYILYIYLIINLMNIIYILLLYIAIYILLYKLLLYVFIVYIY